MLLFCYTLCGDDCAASVGGGLIDEPLTECLLLPFCMLFFKPRLSFQPAALSAVAGAKRKKAEEDG